MLIEESQATAKLDGSGFQVDVTTTAKGALRMAQTVMDWQMGGRGYWVTHRMRGNSLLFGGDLLVFGLTGTRH